MAGAWGRSNGRLLLSELSGTLYDLAEPGRLAQLGERFPYKEEVGGSSPSTPTAENPYVARDFGLLVGSSMTSGPRLVRAWSA